MIDPNTASSPFTVLTFIAAPALLTNATSVLAMSTTTRMLRTRDSMGQLLRRSEGHSLSGEAADQMVAQVNRTEKQAGLLLGALASIYFALGGFSGATLVTLIGAALAEFGFKPWPAYLGVGLGAFGVVCLIIGSVKLFQATQLSITNIHEEAKLIRNRYAHNPADLDEDPYGI
jgi:hypothetical protein